MINYERNDKEEENIAVLDMTTIIESITLVVSATAVITAITGAFKSGVLKRIRLGNLEIEGLESDVSQGRKIVTEFNQSTTDEAPYEAEQLAKYYAQILNQSKVSFWFSLIFASLGFTIITASVVLYSSKGMGTTVASFVAGTIIDAVSALFFIQSKNAQQAMGEFFDKLRRDRQQLEARKICEIIDNPSSKDAVRIQLALHFAEVADPKGIAEAIIKECLH